MIFPNLKKRDCIFLFICAMATFLMYGQSLTGNFVFDDRYIIENENLFLGKEGIGNIILSPFWNDNSGLYRPITLISYFLNFTILSPDPLALHFINLLLYIFTIFFIYLFIKRFFENEKLAYLTSFLFMILPIHSEVVANITGRSELLALFFSLLLMLELSKNKVNFWLAGIWVFLAIGSKESAIAIIPISFLIILIKEIRNLRKEKETLIKDENIVDIENKIINNENKKENLYNKIINFIKKHFLLLSSISIGGLFYFFLRFFSLGQNYFISANTSLIENPLIFTNSFSRIITSFKVFLMYLYKAFWPINLCSDYSYNQIPVLHSWNYESILGLIILFFSIFSIFFFIKKKPELSLAGSILFFFFLPVSNIIFPIGTIAGERLIYSPSLGICLFISYLILNFYYFFEKQIKNIFNKFNNKQYTDNSNTNNIKYLKYIEFLKYTFLLILIMVSIFYIIISFKRQKVWLNEENLFLSAAKCASESVLSRSNAGAIYYLKGDYEKAKIELEYAKSIKPIYSKGLNNLGLVYWKEGKLKEAEEMYLEAIKQDFPYSGAYENLINLYLQEGKKDKARRWMNILYPNIIH